MNQSLDELRRFDVRMCMYVPYIHNLCVRPLAFDFLSHSQLPMAIADMGCNLLDCNARLTEVAGVSREDARHMSIFDLVLDGFVQHAFR